MNHKADSDRHAGVISASAHQIWAAGLGALALAEKEGSRFFDTLSKLGESLHSRTLKTASFAKQTVSGGKHAATESWDKLEELFELRVGRALNALQIPTARDIKELTSRIDELSRSVEELSTKPKARKSKSTKKTAAGKKKGKTTRTSKTRTRTTRTKKAPAARKKKKTAAKTQRKRTRA